jgi:hypothetical protein
MRDKETIRRELAKLNLPSIVAQIFDGAALRSELSYRCEEPHKSLIDGSGFPKHLFPLWECGTTATAYDASDGTFCKIDLEAASQVRFRVKDFDGVVADVLIDLWEDEIPDDDLTDLAREFGFSRLPQLITALECGPTSDYDSWREALRTTNSEQGGDGQSATRPESRRPS